MKSYYHVLGIQNFSQIPEIRSAYRRKALRYHPDRGGDAEKMKEINFAYEYLLKFKEPYDASLKPRPVLAQTGFTIIVNGFGYGFDSVSSATGAYATWA